MSSVTTFRSQRHVARGDRNIQCSAVYRPDLTCWIVSFAMKHKQIAQKVLANSLCHHSHQHLRELSGLAVTDVPVMSSVQYRLWPK